MRHNASHHPLALTDLLRAVPLWPHHAAGGHDAARTVERLDVRMDGLPTPARRAHGLRGPWLTALASALGHGAALGLLLWLGLTGLGSPLPLGGQNGEHGQTTLGGRAAGATGQGMDVHVVRLMDAPAAPGPLAETHPVVASSDAQVAPPETVTPETAPKVTSEASSEAAAAPPPRDAVPVAGPTATPVAAPAPRQLQNSAPPATAASAAARTASTVKPERKPSATARRATPPNTPGADVAAASGASARQATGQTSGQAPGQDVGQTGPAAGQGPAEAAFGAPDGPSYRTLVPPVYPAQARRQGVSGMVLIKVTFLADGRPQRMEVVQSPSPLLSSAALDALRASTFHPLRRNGVPLPCWSLVTVRFQLS